MNRIILQPAGSTIPQQHYNHTIVEPVPLDLIQEYANAKQSKDLADIYNGRDVQLGELYLEFVKSMSVNGIKFNQVISHCLQDITKYLHLE